MSIEIVIDSGNSSFPDTQTRGILRRRGVQPRKSNVAWSSAGTINCKEVPVSTLSRPTRRVCDRVAQAVDIGERVKPVGGDLLCRQLL